jgi:hypothetical protein
MKFLINSYKIIPMATVFTFPPQKSTKIRDISEKNSLILVISQGFESKCCCPSSLLHFALKIACKAIFWGFMREAQQTPGRLTRLNLLI